MAGVMGVGKSTLACQLAEETGAVVLDQDVIKSAALDAGLDWNAAGAVAYTVLRALADSLLQQRRVVILDSPCHYRDVLNKGMALAQHNGAVYAYIECVLADPEEHRRRLHNRVRRRSQGLDLEHPPAEARIGQREQTMTPARKSQYPPSSWLRLDLSRPVEQCVAEAIGYLTRLVSDASTHG